MKRHSKDWYFAAASANDLWAVNQDTNKCLLLTGAPKDSCGKLWGEAILTRMCAEGDAISMLSPEDQAYLTVQYGLERAGLICKERRRKGHDT